MVSADETPGLAGNDRSTALVNEFIRRTEQPFRHRRPLARIGVLYSADSHLIGLLPGGFRDPERQVHLFGHLGWGRFLIEEHLSYRAIPAFRIASLSEIQGLDVLVLPGVEVLSGRILRDVLTPWVRSGKALIATGRTAARRGREQFFRSREADGRGGAPGLADLLLAEPPRVSEVRRLGRGLVISLPGEPGTDYYLDTEGQRGRRALERAIQETRRRELLSPWLDVPDAPRTLGFELFEDRVNGRLLVDCVNYDIDMEQERIRPTRPFRLRVRTPEFLQGEKIHVQIVSPDFPGNPIYLPDPLQEDGWMTLKVTGLHRFATFIFR